MKQTLYEKIRTVVDSWNIAITQNEETKRFNLWSSLYWEWIRVSGSFDSINECYNHLWEHYLTEWEIDIAQQGWERYIWIYERPLWRPKVGDKIQILKVCPQYKIRKEAYWGSEGIDIFDVGEVEDFFCRLKNYRGRIIEYEFPYDCIAPRVSPDE